jgi:LacI family transcriptional regulator
MIFVEGTCAGRCTLREVAELAGVSVSTASRALRGDARVTPPTRRRVEASAAALRFEPNHVARSLRTRSSMLVGVVVPDIAVSFYASALEAAQSVLERSGYQVLVMNTGRDPERERAAIRTLSARRVDGVLLATSGGNALLDVPVVFFDHLPNGTGARAVALDNAEGVFELVEHLARAHGHTRIAYLGAPASPAPGVPRLERGPGAERLEAFRAAMGSFGLATAPSQIAIADCGWSQPSAEDATSRLIRQPLPPTAILAASDSLALGALRAIHRSGRSVPRDIALVCFDDPIAGDLLDPPVTALRRHDRQLGEHAAELLLRALADEPAPEEIVRIRHELVTRRSCGCTGQLR